MDEAPRAFVILRDGHPPSDALRGQPWGGPGGRHRAHRGGGRGMLGCHSIRARGWAGNPRDFGAPHLWIIEFAARVTAPYKRLRDVIFVAPGDPPSRVMRCPPCVPCGHSAGGRFRADGRRRVGGGGREGALCFCASVPARSSLGPQSSFSTDEGTTPHTDRNRNRNRTRAPRIGWHPRGPRCDGVGGSVGEDGGGPPAAAIPKTASGKILRRELRAARAAPRGGGGFSPLL